ncbi:MAG: SDR family oxidoreductase [Acidiferrobacterales bacterium]|nr:SDR family oxidoreductase [Acidiferrobacterales bacterium]
MKANGFDFTNKTVIVVGGTSGINLGVAGNFADAGANVGVIGRSQDKIDAAVQHLTQAGVLAYGFSADVRDYAKVTEAFETFHKKFGEISVLISGAAGNFPARATDMSANGFAAVMNIDLLGSYHVLRAAYPYLVKPGASVINISAPQSFVPMILQSHVCAAKAGVDMLTRTLAMEWGGEGIRVNSIVPGPIQDTEGMRRLAPTAQILDDVSESVPLKRLGSTDDIGQAAMFLSSTLADYITGAILPVDGGWSLSGVSSLMEKLENESN